MNDTIKTIVERRSIRSFTDEKVSQEDLEQILLAGTKAPTGMNKQSPIILVAQNPEMVKKLSKLNAKYFFRQDIDPFYGAGTVLTVLAKKDVHTYIYDGSLVIGNMLLAIESLGLGGIWIHRAKEMFEDEEGKAILKELGLNPDEYEGIGNVCVGHIKGEKPAPKAIKKDYVYNLDKVLKSWVLAYLLLIVTGFIHFLLNVWDLFFIISTGKRLSIGIIYEKCLKESIAKISYISQITSQTFKEWWRVYF